MPREVTIERRDFLRTGLAAGAALATGMNALPTPASAAPAPSSKPRFKLNYAPHFGMFRHHAGDDLISQIQFMADQGFTALEDNGLMSRPVEVQEKIGKELARLGMKMGVFVINAFRNSDVWATTGKKELIDHFVATCRKAVEVAKRVNAKWMTVVPGNFERRLPIGIQTANVIEAMRRGAEVFEPHGLVMVMEPLSDTPDLFLRNADQAYMICKAVNSPSCKILYDIYHMQRNEGHIIPTIDMVWDEIGYFQIGDNPGRKEPTTGEINYRNIFKHIYEKGYTGILGMEHGNSKPGKEGELAVIEAYRTVDAFDTASTRA
ncbi:MAG TPA: TIM barrel protein [Longimicrobiales bacterium]